MNYLLRPRERNKKRKWVGAAAVAGALLFVLIVIPEPSAGALQSIAAPVWRVRNDLGEKLVAAVDAFADDAKIAEENMRLKNEIQNLELRLLDRNLLYEENERLKEAVGRFPDKTSVLAGVLAKPGISPYDTFMLDAGERSGVHIGDRVFADGSILIGEIDRIFSSSSRARLYSTAGVETDVVVGEANVHTTAVGRGGGNFEIELPKEIDVEVGEYITSPGLGPKIFGVVEAIEDRPADSFQRILFKSPVNMAQVETVFIELRKSND